VGKPATIWRAALAWYGLTALWRCGGGGGVVVDVPPPPPTYYSDFSVTGSLSCTNPSVPVLLDFVEMGARASASDAFLFGEDSSAPPGAPASPYVTMTISPDFAKDVRAPIVQGNSYSWTIVVECWPSDSAAPMSLTFVKPVNVPITITDVDGASGVAGAALGASVAWNPPVNQKSTWRFRVSVP